jgi:hypothetical protein
MSMCEFDGWADLVIRNHTSIQCVFDHLADRSGCSRTQWSNRTMTRLHQQIKTWQKATEYSDHEDSRSC